jgi:hypothetical protein
VSQQQAIILAFKIAVIAGFLSLVGWVVVYTRLAKWWKNSIGRTLVAKTLLLAALLVPTALSLFFKFNRLTSYVAGWVDVSLIGLISPVMIWRSVVWIKESRKDKPGPEGVGDE